MRFSRINLFVCLLLALLFVAERMTACVDDCVEIESDTCSASLVTVDDHHHDAGASDGDHCDHCSCACHIPALKAQIVIQTLEYNDTSRYAIHSASLPASPVSTPDHIPLV